MFKPSPSLPDGTYLDLVRSIHATLLPSAIIAVSFIFVGALIAIETPDPALDILIGFGMLAVTARIANLLLTRARISNEALDVAEARILERRFAFFYLSFALLFGAFSARAFQVASPEAHMLILGLMFGYGAGVAVGISLRPRIAIASLLVAILPAAIVAPLTPTPMHLAVTLLLLLFLGGGIHSVMLRYRNAVRGITMRRTYESLARSDALTGLRNRLSLREDFDQVVGRGQPAGILVVHCLDLDKFKPVNDLYGHPVGDALLRAVSTRLNRLLRQGDVAARLGGDEFVVLQNGAMHTGEAELLARRIRREMARPFSIEGHRILIGASVGYAISPDHGRNMDVLIARADDALCRIKRAGGGVAAYVPAAITFERPENRRLSA
jgi:diguanylate cyclase (GGDEF)-like protein